jgi:hypothetical protein
VMVCGKSDLLGINYLDICGCVPCLGACAVLTTRSVYRSLSARDTAQQPATGMPQKILGKTRRPFSGCRVLHVSSVTSRRLSFWIVTTDGSVGVPSAQFPRCRSPTHCARCACVAVGAPGVMHSVSATRRYRCCLVVCMTLSRARSSRVSRRGLPYQPQSAQGRGERKLRR